MSFSKVLFVGLGGAGQRHLRILKQLLPSDTTFLAYRRTGETPLLRADFSVDAQNTIESAYDLQIFDDLDAAFACGPDLTVISTPTSCHREPMMKAMSASSGVLVEKPWAESLDRYEEFSDGMLAKKLPFLISFQRRFHTLISQARTVLKSGAIGRPVAATFNVYSHVPSWHAYEDWHNLYAVRSDLGGGVLLTEIHEIDLAYWFFGMPDAVFCSGGNRASEKIEVEDTVQITLLYDNFSVQITLCFMHEKPSRNFHIAGTGGDIKWVDGINELTTTSFNGLSKVYAEPDFLNDTMFEFQAEKFINDWALEDTVNSLSAAFCSLAIVETAKRSMESGRAEKIITKSN